MRINLNKKKKIGTFLFIEIRLKEHRFFFSEWRQKKCVEQPRGSISIEQYENKIE